MRHLKLALAATCLSIAAPALAGPTEDFHKLMDDYWATTLKDAPLFATQAGVTTYDRELGVVTLAEFDRQTAEGAAFLKRLDAIPVASLPPADQTNYAILKRTLSDAVAANQFGERQMLYSTLGSLHQYYAGIGEQQPFRTYADYDNYLARIGLVPAQMANMADISRKAAKEGFVQPCVTLTTFEPTVVGSMSDPRVVIVVTAQ